VEVALEQVPQQERLQYLDELADLEPHSVRAWIESHPRNLMMYNGWDPMPFHDAAFNDALDAENQSFFWLAPRGSGKSTALAVFLSGWLAIARRENWHPRIPDLFAKAPRSIGPHNIRIALTSNSAGNAIDLHNQVKGILTSRRMSKLFGPLAGNRWKDEKSWTRLRTENFKEGTFTALGLGSRVTGGHYDAVVCDDWVTEDNARTELQRRRIKDFWKFTVRPTREPWARVIVDGTRYHPKDWYGDLAEMCKRDSGWHHRRTPALTQDDDGSDVSYWPELYPLDELYGIRDEIGHIAFATQYQNEVDLLQGDFFDGAWLERFGYWANLAAEERRQARTVLALDPCIKGGPLNDWGVFSLVSYAQPDFWIRRIWRGKWTQDEMVSMAVRLWQEHRPYAVTVESVQGQEYLLQEMRRRTRLPVKGFNPRISKLGRAEKARTYFETGRVVFEAPQPGNNMQIAIEEMMGFDGSRGAQDDCVDSIVIAMLTLIAGRSRLGRVRR
jgi:predicted phage terminase large subunit-like protein